MAGYSRQSSAQILSGEIVSAAPLNAEFNQVLAAFSESSGHNHDGTTGEGSPIDRLADADQFNKILVDTTNNHLEFYVQVSSGSVEQIKIQDGAIVPVTDNDIDLGTSSLEFKDLHLDGTANIDALVADTADINGGTVDGTAIGGTSASTGAFTTISATGVVSVSDGSAGAPAITNTGDTNNGLYFNTADELSYTSGGTAQVTFADGVIKPVTDNDIDLGTSSLEFKDAFFDGTVTTDALVADTADINGGTADDVIIGGTTAAAGSFSTLSATGVVSVSDGSAGAPAITNTGDTNNGLYFNAADELSYTSGGTAQVTFKDGAIVPVTDNDIDLGTSSLEFKDLYVDGTAYLDSVNIAGGSITGISTLADLGNAVPMAFSTTTTDSDPGGGNVRLNNATQNAATAFYIDDADSNAAAIATFVQSLSGGNNPSSILGFVTLRKQYAPEVFATYKVTAVVNASGYTKLTVANLAASATNPFSDADAVLLSIDLAGDKGDAGELAGPGSSTDNAVVRFNGTGGAAVQNSAVIIDDSNVVSGITSLTVDNININGNTITSTDTNGTITLTPDGTGDVILSADTVQIGDSNANATLTTVGTGDLTLSTNNGTNSGTFSIADAANGDISLTPNGSGVVAVSSDVTLVDNKYLIAGSNSDIKIGYDESGGDALQIGANVEGAALKIHYYADEADDDADNWLHQVADGGTMTWGSKISGSYVTHLTMTPNSTAASSTIAAAGHLTVAGNLTVSGTTTTVNSTITTIKDPLIDLGGGDDGAAPGTDDNKDRGLILQWHNGSAAKKAFIGYDDSASKFTMIADAAVSSEVVSGTASTVVVGGVEFIDGTSFTTVPHNLGAMVALGVF